MRRHQQLPSCTGDHFTAAATTTPPPAVTFLQKQLPVLHWRPSFCTSRYQQLPVLHQHLPVLHSLPSCSSDYQFCTSSRRSCTSDRLPAPTITFLHEQTPATTSPEPAITFLRQQLPVLNQRPLSCTSRSQQQPVLHQQLPVLHQQPPSCTSGNQSCTSDHLSNEYQSGTGYPDLLQRLDLALTITIRPRRLFTVRFSDLRFAIMKFGLSKQHPCFVILA